MIFSTNKGLFSIPAVIFIAGILFSCVNDLDEIQKVSFDPNAPDEVTKDLELFYNDSGRAQVRIYAKIAETYLKPQKITKLKDGLRVDFYERDGNIVSTLTALYGEINYETGKIFVSDSVQLRNHEKEQVMETEIIYLNEKDSTIYTDKNVVIRTPKSMLFGRGIRTKRAFNEDVFQFIEPQGKIDVTENN